MGKALIACGVAASLMLPAGALGAKPVDKRHASKECRAERGSDPATQEAFRQKYGTNENGKNAFGKCVSGKAKKAEQQEDAEDLAAIEATKNAAKECDAERGDTAESRAAFQEKYGTNKNKKNAFGKCVSGKVHES